jgi:hypothetical protein
MLLDNALECNNGLGWFHLSNTTRDALNEDPLSVEKTLKELDWTNGIVYDGYDTGIATQVIILSAAKTYTIVLINTEDADANFMSNVVALEGMALLHGEPPWGPGAYGDNAPNTTKAPTNTTINGNSPMATISSNGTGTQLDPTASPATNPSSNIFNHGNGTEGLVEGDSEPGPWNQTVGPGKSNGTDPPDVDPPGSDAVLRNGFQIATTGTNFLTNSFVALLCSLLLW